MYTYSRMSEDLSYLSYCGVHVGTLGLSTLKNDIPYVHVGDYTGGQSIITGGIHARENITSLLVMRQAFRAAFTAKPLQGGIYFVPMVNTDGALLIEKGADIANGLNIKSAENKKADQNQNSAYNQHEKSKNKAISQADYLRQINGSNDFSLWKSNINGVDLNNNFDAEFASGLGQKISPSPQGYPGEYPFSEVESRALKDFTIKVKPQITLSYHALGQELYWYFFQKSSVFCGEKSLQNAGGNPDSFYEDIYDRDKKIASKINSLLGYKMVDDDMGSTGGYKDWCISYLKIPALTVEIIDPCFTHPLGDIDPDWKQNKDIPYALADIANRLYLKKKLI